MYSDTHLTLTEYAELMGINPWRMAQINRNPAPASPLPPYVADANECACIYQYTWQSKWLARSDFAQGIRRAEEIFEAMTCAPVAPSCVQDERHAVPERQNVSNGVRYRIVPKKAQVRGIGACVITPLNDGDPVTILRGSHTTTPNDVFEFEVPVPDGTKADELLVYYAPTDGGWSAQPGLVHQIRPLKITIDSAGGTGAWVARFKGAAYLFVKPALYEDPAASQTCLSHVYDTYVNSAVIYRRTLNPCNHGVAHFPAAPCLAVPCQDVTRPICLTPHSEHSYSIGFAECNQSNVRVPYALTSLPNAFTIHYMAGYALQDGRIAPPFADILAALATAMIECENPDNCQCKTCHSEKFTFYQQVPKVKVGEGTFEGIRGDQWLSLITFSLIDKLGGMLPRQGLLYGLNRLNKYKCA